MEDGQPRQTRTAPLTEQAYQALRSAIMAGKLTPGGKLKIDTLQSSLGFSSTPLREALNRLVVEGLATSDERRGFRAAQLSEGDLLDLTAARVVCEVGAFATSIKQGTDEWESHIVAAHHRLEWIEKRIENKEQERNQDWTLRHKEFHMALISACGSDRLLTTCSGLFDQAERYRRTSVLVRPKPRNIAEEHSQLMHAALERDVDRASSLLETHITLTTNNLVEYMHATGGDYTANNQDDK